MTAASSPRKFRRGSRSRVAHIATRNSNGERRSDAPRFAARAALAGNRPSALIGRIRRRCRPVQRTECQRPPPTCSAAVASRGGGVRDGRVSAVKRHGAGLYQDTSTRAGSPGVIRGGAGLDPMGACNLPGPTVVTLFPLISELRTVCGA